MKDDNNRTDAAEADVETTAGEPKKGGITKRQLWVAPVVMAVNLPSSVFAQVSPVGTPTATGAPPTAAPPTAAPPTAAPPTPSPAPTLPSPTPPV